jgi:hypothetical protein
MISLALARQLRAAGLKWTPTKNDFFVVPDRGLDEHIFVIGEMIVGMEKLDGQPVFSFQGASEWALDYVMTGEALWLPTEAQVRAALEEQLKFESERFIQLTVTADRYRCEIRYGGQPLTFEAGDAAEAWGAALIYVLTRGAQF